VAFAFGLVLLFSVRPAVADWTMSVGATWVQQENDLTPHLFPGCVTKRSAWFGCSAATAKMVVESNPINGTVRTLAQNRTDIEASRLEGPACAVGDTIDGFYGDPPAVVDVIGTYDVRDGAGGSPARWLISSLGDVKAAAGKLAYTLDRYGTASATLVEAGGHWVAVVGARTDIRPTTAIDNAQNFKVLKMFILDPDPAAKPAGKNQVVPWVTWSRSYQTPDAFGTTYKNKMVSVVDPDPPPTNVDQPTRGPVVGPVTTAAQAMTIATNIVAADTDLTSAFLGLSVQAAEHVIVSQTTDKGWWVGFGSSTSSVQAGVLIDDQRQDLLVAGWSTSADAIPWASRQLYWPYLASGRGPTAAPSRGNSDLYNLFYVTPAAPSVPAMGVGTIGVGLRVCLLGFLLVPAVTILIRRRGRVG
jgi:hypothetical protein